MKKKPVSGGKRKSAEPHAASGELTAMMKNLSEQAAAKRQKQAADGRVKELEQQLQEAQAEQRRLVPPENGSAPVPEAGAVPSSETREPPIDEAFAVEEGQQQTVQMPEPGAAARQRETPSAQAPEPQEATDGRSAGSTDSVRQEERPAEQHGRPNLMKPFDEQASSKNRTASSQHQLARQASQPAAKQQPASQLASKQASQ